MENNLNDLEKELLILKKKQDNCMHDGLLWQFKDEVEESGKSYVRCECMDCLKHFDLPVDKIDYRVIRYTNRKNYDNISGFYRGLRSANIPLNEIVKCIELDQMGRKI